MKRRLPMAPDVAEIERILTAAAGVPRVAEQLLDDKPPMAHALWLCPCYVDDELDAPTWLLFDTSEGDLGWCRSPDELDASMLLAARQSVGGHTEPSAVLDWLRGVLATPWLDQTDAFGEPAVVPALARFTHRAGAADG